MNKGYTITGAIERLSTILDAYGELGIVTYDRDGDIDDITIKVFTTSDPKDKAVMIGAALEDEEPEPEVREAKWENQPGQSTAQVMWSQLGSLLVEWKQLSESYEEVRHTPTPQLPAVFESVDDMATYKEAHDEYDEALASNARRRGLLKDMQERVKDDIKEVAQILLKEAELPLNRSYALHLGEEGSKYLIDLQCQNGYVQSFRAYYNGNPVE